MDRFRGQIVTRLLAGIAFGVLFLAGGFYCVGKFLTPDLMIRQQLHFKIPETHQEKFATQWAAFAQEQQVQLLKLAEKNLPYLVSYVSVIPQTMDPIITLRLRCPPNADEKIHQKFNDLVAAYTAQRTAIEQSEVIFSSDAVFHARLDLSEPYIYKYYPFSRFQQFVLVVFALAGFLLGIGPPGGYLHDNDEEPVKTPREICRAITSASSELAVLSTTTFDTATATQAVVTIPKKKVHREPEQTILPIVERITVDEAGIATERAESKPEESDTQEKAEAPQDIKPAPAKKPVPEPEPKPDPEPELEVDVDVKPPAPVKKPVPKPEPKPIPKPEPEVDVEEKPPAPRNREEHREKKIETIPLAQPEEDDIIEEEQAEAVLEPVWQEEKIREEIPAEPAEPAQETHNEEITDEKAESIFEEEEIPVEKPAVMMDEEEIENHSHQQEVLLSEIVIPKKKKDIDSTENIADDSAKAAIEPEPEPEPVEPEPDTTKVEPVSPSKPQPEPSQEPVLSESEESMVAEEQESIPVVAIDLNKDMPTAQAAGTAGAARSKYDTLADLIEKLRPQVRCPVIVVSALKPKDVSPRLTVNLAVTLIRRALRVLIVEADPSNKELATLFGLPEEPGFFEWRRGAAWISHTTHRTQLVGLSVMPAGIPNESQKNPDLELWREKHRWGNLSNDFDVVLLYYPSALVEQPQSPEQIMGAHLRDMAHGVLALIRSTKQIEKNAQTVVDNLADHTAQLLAMVPIKT